MRAKIHHLIPTTGHKLDEKRVIKNQTREVILTELKTPSIK
jgi:hypothetical protein